MNRCLNDVFAYCTGTPVPATTTTKVTEYGIGGRPFLQDFVVVICKKDLHTCGHFKAHTQLHASILSGKH